LERDLNRWKAFSSSFPVFTAISLQWPVPELEPRVCPLRCCVAIEQILVHEAQARQEYPRTQQSSPESARNPKSRRGITKIHEPMLTMEDWLESVS
jgi:hypothetical protein